MLRYNMFRVIWTDGDSTLYSWMWRAHHNGLALLLTFVLGVLLNLFLKDGFIYSAIIISEIGIIVNKLFIQGNGIKSKTMKDIKDLASDWLDYQVVWLPIFYFEFSRTDFILSVAIYLIFYYLTYKLKWTNP